MLLLAAASALARPTVEVFGGYGLPLDPENASDPGIDAGLAVGWCLGLGPLLVQPEIYARTNLAAPVIVAGVGGQVFLGRGLFQLGPYARVGVGLQGYPLPTPEAGLSLVLNPPTPLVLGVRAGWQWDHPLRYKCGNCEQPSEQWLVGSAFVGVRL